MAPATRCVLRVLPDILLARAAPPSRATHAGTSCSFIPARAFSATGQANGLVLLITRTQRHNAQRLRATTQPRDAALCHSCARACRASSNQRLSRTWRGRFAINPTPTCPLQRAAGDAPTPPIPSAGLNARRAGGTCALFTVRLTSLALFERTMRPSRRTATCCALPPAQTNITCWTPPRRLMTRWCGGGRDIRRRRRRQNTRCRHLLSASHACTQPST